MVKQISDNEIYLLIKYIKSVLWRVVKRLSYIKDARCLKVKKQNGKARTGFIWIRRHMWWAHMNMAMKLWDL